jgi:hypothetical protein
MYSLGLWGQSQNGSPWGVWIDYTQGLEQGGEYIEDNWELVSSQSEEGGLNMGRGKIRIKPGYWSVM